jgi:hypothetical protein
VEPPSTWHREMAVATFNRTWELIEKRDRSENDDSEMLRSAFASRYHWEQVGGDEERAVGDWQIAHVASLLGHAALALRYARSALDITIGHQWRGWRLASCYEGMARAYAVTGDRGDRDRYVALARDELERIDDPDDRALIEKQLAAVP